MYIYIYYKAITYLELVIFYGGVNGVQQAAPFSADAFPRFGSEALLLLLLLLLLIESATDGSNIRPAAVVGDLRVKWGTGGDRLFSDDGIA